jgi:hypothetical protein
MTIYQLPDNKGHVALEAIVHLSPPRTEGYSWMWYTEATCILLEKPIKLHLSGKRYYYPKGKSPYSEPDARTKERALKEHTKLLKAWESTVATKTYVRLSQ